MGIAGRRCVVSMGTDLGRAQCVSVAAVVGLGGSTMEEVVMGLEGARGPDRAHTVCFRRSR